MGQYWIPVNLTKREYIDPHKLGIGLKLIEQAWNNPGTGTALVILCAAMPEARGGGDFDVSKPNPRFWRDDGTPEDYWKVAKRTIGRWAGDKIALVGDYAERSDLPEEFDADLIYGLCCSKKEKRAWINRLRQHAREGVSHPDEYTARAARIEALETFKDISEDVALVIEREIGGKYSGDGWRKFTPNDGDWPGQKISGMPDPDTPPGILADWLEDHNHPRAAKLIRDGLRDAQAIVS